MFYYHLVDSQVIIPLTTNINHQAADQVSHQVSSSNLWLTRVSPPSFFSERTVMYLSWLVNLPPIKGTTMVNNPLLKALFVMGVPYMGVGWLAMYLMICVLKIIVIFMSPKTWWFIHLQQPGFLNVSNKHPMIRIFDVCWTYNSPPPLKPRSWAALPSINGVISPLNGLING